MMSVFATHRSLHMDPRLPVSESRTKSIVAEEHHRNLQDLQFICKTNEETTSSTEQQSRNKGDVRFHIILNSRYIGLQIPHKVKCIRPHLTPTNDQALIFVPKIWIQRHKKRSRIQNLDRGQEQFKRRPDPNFRQTS